MSQKMATRRRWLRTVLVVPTVPLACLISSYVAARVFVGSNGGFGAGDIRPFVFYTVPFFRCFDCAVVWLVGCSNGRTRGSSNNRGADRRSVSGISLDHHQPLDAGDVVWRLELPCFVLLDCWRSYWNVRRNNC